MTTICDPQQAPALPGLSHTRAAGALILFCSIVSIIFVALDPMATGRDALSVLQSMVRNQSLHQWVHVVAMFCVVGLQYGYIVLSQRLGLHRPAVRIGLISFTLGAIMMFIGTTIDGFISTDTAAFFVKASPDAVRVGAWMIDVMEGIVLTDIARIAWILQSIAAAAWSFALLRQSGLQRRIGAVGLFAGLLPAAAVIQAGSNMTVTVVVGVLLIQGIWHVAAGVLLLMLDRRGQSAHRGDTLGHPGVAMQGRGT